MQRLLAVRNAVGTYHCAAIMFSTERTPRMLERRYPTLYAAQMMISTGDLISVDIGIIRASNGAPCQREHALPEVMAYAARRGIHHISFHDAGDQLMEEVGIWEMTCPEGHDIFVENLGTAIGWYHVIDSAVIEEIYHLPKVA